MDKEELIKKTLEDLSKRYLTGLYEYLFRHRRELYNELSQLEDAIVLISLSYLAR